MNFSKSRREEAWPFYEEGGRAVAELLCHHPEKEPEVWALMAGTGIWKRWYLKVFKSFWKAENPREYNNAKHRRHNRKRYARDKQRRLEARRREAADKAAMLNQAPSSDEEPPQ
jgi:hypothetical protein